VEKHELSKLEFEIIDKALKELLIQSRSGHGRRGHRFA
jgi:hypothetical protein